MLDPTWRNTRPSDRIILVIGGIGNPALVLLPDGRIDDGSLAINYEGPVVDVVRRWLRGKQVPPCDIHPGILAELDVAPALTPELTAAMAQSIVELATAEHLMDVVDVRPIEPGPRRGKPARRRKPVGLTLLPEEREMGAARADGLGLSLSTYVGQLIRKDVASARSRAGFVRPR